MARQSRRFGAQPAWLGSYGGRRSREHAVALLVDDLLGFRDREGDGVIPAAVGVRANEAVLLDAFGRVLLDGARRLVLIFAQVRGGPDAVAVVFDGRNCGCVRRAGRSAGETGPRRFELREHAITPLVDRRFWRVRSGMSTAALSARRRRAAPAR